MKGHGWESRRESVISARNSAGRSDCTSLYAVRPPGNGIGGRTAVAFDRLRQIDVEYFCRM
jgi:hypothetical protein